MTKDQTNAFHKTSQMLENTSDAMHDYWISYSNMGTWQFWLLIVMLVAPIIVLYFYLDRSKALLVGFFGFNIHAWFHYCDLFTTTRGYTGYPYKIVPFLPVSLTLDTSIVPVAFMLLYQWTLNRNKNYYLYAILASAFFSFIVKPILNALDLIKLMNHMNYATLFALYIVIVVLAKLITNVFVYFQAHDKRGNRETHHRIHFSRFDNRKKAR